jgi:nitrogenase molybdenum-iron protein alpha/beta subunit
MTGESSLAPFRPDSFVGSIAAFEGIRGACALVNSPLGCRTYTAYLVDWQDPQPAAGLSSMSGYYFGWYRAPSDYLDEKDYIMGSEGKLADALRFVDSKGYGLVGVINSPGTTLIGEDLKRIIRSSQVKVKTVAIESTGFNGTFADGFKGAMVEILKAVAKPGQKVPGSVNIIGPNIFQYNWESDVAELKRMLGLVGAEVLSVVCAGESPQNLERAGRAELNIVVYEEYGDAIASHMEKEFGIPSFGTNELAPIGLESSEAWLKAVAGQLGLPKNMEQAVVEPEAERVRVRCGDALERVSRYSGGLKGMSFGVFGDSSQVVPATVFLHRYLGMYPALITIREAGNANCSFIRDYIAKNSLDTAVLMQPDQYAVREHLAEKGLDLVLGSSIEEYIINGLERRPAFVPFSFPYNKRIVLTARPTVGFNGVLTLVEDILNSLRQRILET